MRAATLTNCAVIVPRSGWMRPLRDIVDALGGDWNDVQPEWKRVKTAIEQKGPPLSFNQVKEKIEKVLASASAQVLTEDSANEIKNALKQSSPWSAAKTGGRSAVPNGDPSKALADVLKKLNGLGIFVVEIGDLESFDRTCAGHGPKWVAEVLTKDLNRPDLREAREFVGRLRDSWG